MQDFFCVPVAGVGSWPACLLGTQPVHSVESAGLLQRNLSLQGGGPGRVHLPPRVGGGRGAGLDLLSAPAHGDIGSNFYNPILYDLKVSFRSESVHVPGLVLPGG